MGKYLRYDAEGNERYFLHAIDARECVENGSYFETNPIKDAEKRASLQKKEEVKAPVIEEKKSFKKEEVKAPVVEDVKDEEK